MISLFDKIRFRLQDHCESGDCRKYCHECDFKTALRILDEVEAEYGNGWIPVEHEEPKDLGTYLITVMVKAVGEDRWTINADVGTLDFDGWETYHDWDEGTETRVIAWMPLPEGYKPQT